MGLRPQPILEYHSYGRRWRIGRRHIWNVKSHNGTAEIPLVALQVGGLIGSLVAAWLSDVVFRGLRTPVIAMFCLLSFVPRVSTLIRKAIGVELIFLSTFQYSNAAGCLWYYVA